MDQVKFVSPRYIDYIPQRGKEIREGKLLHPETGKCSEVRQQEESGIAQKTSEVFKKVLSSPVTLYVAAVIGVTLLSIAESYLLKKVPIVCGDRPEAQVAAAQLVTGVADGLRRSIILPGR